MSDDESSPAEYSGSGTKKVTVSEPYYKTDSGRKKSSEMTAAERESAARPSYATGERRYSRSAGGSGSGKSEPEPVEDRIVKEGEDAPEKYYQMKEGKLPSSKATTKERMLFRMETQGEISEQERRQAMGMPSDSITPQQTQDQQDYSDDWIDLLSRETDLSKKDIQKLAEDRKEQRPAGMPQKQVSWTETVETLHPRPGMDEALDIFSRVSEKPEGPSERTQEIVRRAEYFREHRDEKIPEEQAEIQAANLAKLGVTREEFDRAQDTDRPVEVKEVLEGLDPTSEKKREWTETELKILTEQQESSAEEIYSTQNELNKVIRERNRLIVEKGAAANVSSYDKRIDVLEDKLSDQRTKYTQVTKQKDLPLAQWKEIQKEAYRQQTKKKVWESFSPYEKAYVQELEGKEAPSEIEKFTAVSKGYATQAIADTSEWADVFAPPKKSLKQRKQEIGRGIQAVGEGTEGTVIGPLVSKYVGPKSEGVAKRYAEVRGPLAQMGGEALRGAGAAIPTTAAFVSGTLSVHEEAMKEKSPVITAFGLVGGPAFSMLAAPGVWGGATVRGVTEQAEAFTQDPFTYVGRSIGTAAALKGLQIVGKKGGKVAKKGFGKFKTKARQTLGTKRFTVDKGGGITEIKRTNVLPGEKKLILGKKALQSKKAAVSAELRAELQKFSLDVKWRAGGIKMRAKAKIPSIGERGGFGAGRTFKQVSPKKATGIQTKTLTKTSTIPKSLTQISTITSPSSLTFTTPMIDTEEILSTESELDARTKTLTVPQVRTLVKPKMRTKTRMKSRTAERVSTKIAPLVFSGTTTRTSTDTIVSPLTSVKSVSKTKTKTIPQVITETVVIDESEPVEPRWTELQSPMKKPEKKKERDVPRKRRKGDTYSRMFVTPPQVSAEIYEAKTGGSKQAPMVGEKAAEEYMRELHKGVGIDVEFQREYELQPEFMTASPESTKRKRGGGFLAPRAPLGEISGMVPPKTKKKMARGELKGAPKGPKKQRKMFEARLPKTSGERKRFGHSQMRLGFRDVFKKPKKKKSKTKGFSFEFTLSKIGKEVDI